METKTNYIEENFKISTFLKQASLATFKLHIGVTATLPKSPAELKLF